MRNMPTWVVGIALAIAVAGCTQQPTGVAAAAEAMGATNLNTIEYSGSGSNFAFGQATSPGERWPRFEAQDLRRGRRLSDAGHAAGHAARAGRAPAAAAAAASRSPETSGRSRWSATSMRGPRAAPSRSPNPGAVSDRLRQVWLTPHGVIKAAVASGATANGNVLSLNIEGREVKATLNDQNLVERVEYLTTNSVVGDVPVEITYSDYADFGGIKFPRRIVEKQDGFDTLDVTIKDVRPNAAVSLDVPANVAQAPGAAATPSVDVQKVGDGLWSVNAANTRSLAVEFTDHIVMLEGPDERRSIGRRQ